MVDVSSIKNEIDAHRGLEPENIWLSEIGLINSPGTPYSYELVRDWHRAGAESYILDFIINSGTDSWRLIAKACINMCATETVKEWHQRRRRVKSAGIEVPALYSTHGATYIEEYIPMDLRTAYGIATGEQRHRLEKNFIKTHKKLRMLGFSAVSLHDVRSRGKDVVLIDFGSDLGGFTNANSENESSDSDVATELQRIVEK